MKLTNFLLILLTISFGIDSLLTAYALPKGFIELNQWTLLWFTHYGILGLFIKYLISVIVVSILFIISSKIKKYSTEFTTFWISGLLIMSVYAIILNIQGLF